MLSLLVCFDHLSRTDLLLKSVASRAVGEPVIPAEGTKAVPTHETSRPVTGEPGVVTSTAEVTPKPVKRNSLFGNLWGKKDSGATSPRDSVPPIASKEPETTPVSATAPRIEAPINNTSPDSGIVEPAPTPVADAAGSAPATTTGAVASPPTPSTDKRRSSFFNALGGKKEKKAEGTPDAEGIDAEGKKSNTGKFTGLFRKPSKATPPAPKETSPTTGAPPTVPEGETSQAASEPAAADQKGPLAVSA